MNSTIDTEVTILRSLIDGNLLMEVLQSTYEIEQITSLTCLAIGENNESYLVATNGKRYCVRIYGYNLRLRSELDIQFELSLLDYLSGLSASAHRVIRTREDRLWSSIDFPEGERLFALFEYVEGELLSTQSLDSRTAYNLGKKLAEVHILSDHFTRDNVPHSTAFYLNSAMPYLIELFADNREIIAQIEEINNYFESSIPITHSFTSDYGIIHGDFHLDNVIKRKDELVFIDFAECGWGWRIFDVAKAKESFSDLPENRKYWPYFKQGYLESNPLEHDSLEVFNTMYLLEEFESDIWMHLCSPFQRYRSNRDQILNSLTHFNNKIKKL